ncbi:MAG: cupin domain-containing protein [Acutalibacteraceae bacterium]|nr:cupin domain-containing protein [Acutalibacteraceae bacterium]
MIKIIKPDFVFEDERGTLTQLIHEGYNQINVVTSKAGVERGNHYHALNREGFYVVDGSFLLEATLNGKSESYQFKKGDMFIIEPNVMHRFVYLEDTVLVAFYDKGVELPDGTKDIIAEAD